MKQLTIYMILFSCVFFWASNFIIGSILIEHWSPIMVANFRLMVIVLFLGCISWKAIIRTTFTRNDLLLLIIAGILGVSVNHYSFYASLQHTSPITAALILACAPIVTSLLNKMIYHESRNGIFWLGAIISFIGVGLIITKGALITISIGKGEVLSLITMLSFALFLIIVNHLSLKLSAQSITFYTNLIGLLVLVPFSFTMWTRINWQVTYSYWMLLILSAVIIHGISNLLWNQKMKEIGSTNASLLLNFEPAIAMLLSAIFLKQFPTSVQVYGSLLILLGILLCIYYKEIRTLLFMKRKTT
ncbi:DMT family transporter [Lysinibacillus fusiformis]|uniref:DMT family transporter n=1 Tax=Lysinibacillus fusiformis TaxID=28031 RepID=UPI000D34343A|nr:MULTISPECIES: DMT family transporter [Lysinibacillus]MED4670780.1 DMT family transporter [Lysinibacillus fusiformis]QAS57086.1 multidrug transporter [Lysinibacillus sphaericus]RDV26265.1 multidrug transporter [Lysinibacillus fusiformis]GED63139.1 membrane protein [Lysinibacillus fusiformis]